MQYINYNELKDQIIVSKEYFKKFREQTDKEKQKLKERLLFHKRILSPLIVQKTFAGTTLIDGKDSGGS